MHELPLLENVFSIIIDAARANSCTKIVSVSVRLGPFTDADELWLNRYFEVLARGTCAEGAVLKITRDTNDALSNTAFVVDSIEIL